MAIRVRSAAAGALAGFLLVPFVAVAQTTVTTCGQTITGDGVLGTDLDCTGFDPAITLSDASFDLAGFEFTGRIRCGTSCGVVGPGTLNGDIDGDPGTNIVVAHAADVYGDVHSDSEAAVVAGATLNGTIEGDAVFVLNAYVKDGSGTGVSANFVGMVQSLVSGHSGNGVECTKCELYQSLVGYNDGSGVVCNRPLVDPKHGKAYLYSTSVERNGGHGIDCLKSVTLDGGYMLFNGGTNVLVLGGEKDGGPRWGKVSASAATINFGAVGIQTLKAKLRDSTVTANETDGIRARKIKLLGSQAEGNRTSPDCGVTGSCADLRSPNRPALDGTSSCETSLDDADVTWGVCSLD